MTYGAGGSTRDTTVGTVASIQQGHAVAPHLSFGSDDEGTILSLLKTYQAAGIDRLVALRNDLPSGWVAPGSWCTPTN